MQHRSAKDLNQESKVDLIWNEEVLRKNKLA